MRAVGWCKWRVYTGAGRLERIELAALPQLSSLLGQCKIAAMAQRAALILHPNVCFVTSFTA